MQWRAVGWKRVSTSRWPSISAWGGCRHATSNSAWSQDGEVQAIAGPHTSNQLPFLAFSSC